MFTTPCYIIKNTPELREKLDALGYKVLPNFLDFPCLATTQDGIAIPADTYNRDGGTDCGKNEDLFLALAALRDDSDYMQWFCDNRKANWVICKDDGNQNHLPRGRRGWWTEYGILHKATVDEIIEKFKVEKEEVTHWMPIQELPVQ